MHTQVSFVLKPIKMFIKNNFFVAYQDCGSSDNDDSKSDKIGSLSASSSSSESDDAGGDNVDFFGLSSKQEVENAATI